MGAFADAAYTGVAAYGRVNAVIGAVITVLIMVVMVAVGGNILFGNEVRLTAKVVDAEKLADPTPNNSRYQVALTLQYEYPKGVTQNVKTSVALSTIPVAGSTIPVGVKPDAPATPRVRPASGTVGGLLIAGGLVIGGAGVAMAYFSLKNKAFAATVGTVDAASSVF